MNEAISIPGLLFFNLQNNSSLVRATCRALTVKSRRGVPRSPGMLPTPCCLPSATRQETTLYHEKGSYRVHVVQEHKERIVSLLGSFDPVTMSSVA